MRLYNTFRCCCNCCCFSVSVFVLNFYFYYFSAFCFVSHHSPRTIQRRRRFTSTLLRYSITNKYPRHRWRQRCRRGKWHGLLHSAVVFAIPAAHASPTTAVQPRTWLGLARGLSVVLSVWLLHGCLVAATTTCA